MIERTLPRLEAAVNEESWEWLQDNLPGLAQAVQAEVASGASPEEIRRRMMRLTGRPALVMRLFQAAAHLKNGE